VEFQYHRWGSWRQQSLENVVKDLDQQGFSCYWAGQGYLWRLTGDQCFLQHYHAKHKAHISCANRNLVPQLVDIMEDVFQITLASGNEFQPLRQRENQSKTANADKDKALLNEFSTMQTKAMMSTTKENDRNVEVSFQEQIMAATNTAPEKMLRAPALEIPQAPEITVDDSYNTLKEQGDGPASLLYRRNDVNQVQQVRPTGGRNQQQTQLRQQDPGTSKGEHFVEYLNKEQSASNTDVAAVSVRAREASAPHVTDQFSPTPGQSAHPVLNQGPPPNPMLFFSSQVLNGPTGKGSEEPKDRSLQLNPDRLKPN
jgi:hypothetical protein